ANRIRGRIDTRWICHGGTTRTRVTRCDYHHNAGSGLSFNSGLQRVRRTTLGRRTQPGIVGNVRRLRWVGVAAADPRRRKEPLHALDVSGRCAISLVHVTATYPLRAGRHPDLVTHAIVTDHGTGGVRAVRDVVARERRIVAAGIAAAVMD